MFMILVNYWFRFKANGRLVVDDNTNNGETTAISLVMAMVSTSQQLEEVQTETLKATCVITCRLKRKVGVGGFLFFFTVDLFTQK